MITDAKFRAMGSDCRIVVDGEAGLADSAQARIAGLELRWSGVLDSEITRLNAAGGAMTVVSADTYLLVTRAVSATQETDGCFDATISTDPDAAWALDRRATARGDRRAHRRHSPVQIGLIPEIRGVLLPAGSSFDPYRIGKGLAADVVVAEAMAAGARGVVVELGGDVRVAGVPFAEDCWQVMIADPFERDGVIGTVSLADGAVVTASTRRRRWHPDDNDRHHHVVDPATRKPARGGLVAVSAVAGTGWWAQALAEAVLVAGLRHGEQLVRRHGASALAVRNDGRVEVLGASELIELPA
jgi:thiamine biosynthesis lipoprotein